MISKQASSNIKKLKSMIVVGLMSGTSLDGIDGVIVKINPSIKDCNNKDYLPKLNIELISSKVFMFDPSIRKLLMKVIEGKECTLDILCKLNFQLGELLARSVLDLISESGISISDVDLISSHGQTIYHIPSKEIEFGYPVTSTLQIGESSIIAHRTGITTISDFRPRDIAAGGQGAPLVCYADCIMLSDPKETRLIQNIGGISNVTVLSRNISPFAFDNGPGNALIDLISQKYFGVDYDKDGNLASQGKIQQEFIDNILISEEYFSIRPPKTTGKELFNYAFIEKYLLDSGIKDPYDIIANFTALTARSIAKSYYDYIFPVITPDSIILGGGGAYNKYLIYLLENYLDNKFKIKTHKDLGISDTFKEAIAFAILGYTSFWGIPNNVPSCTGASENVVLGKITPGKNFLYR